MLLHSYRIAAYYFTLLLFGVGGLSLNVFCWFVLLAPRSEARERFVRSIVHQMLRFFIWWMNSIDVVRVRYDGSLASIPAGSVVIANHPGLMDITYILARIPDAFCLFKPGIRRNPILGAAAVTAGYVISNNGVDSIRMASQKVAEGSTLVIFPEGTRTPPNTDLGPLRAGFALIASRAKAPIQLLRIHTNGPLLGKARAWWKLPLLPGEVLVEMGPRFIPSPAATTDEIMKAVERWLRRESADLPDCIVSQ